MLLKRLEIRNVRKIKQAEIDFHGPGVQVIEGINQSGKTTIGQAIAISMNGTKDFTPGMITRGEEEAEIIAFTDDELKIRTVISGSVKQSVFKYDEGLRRHIAVSGGVRTFLESICSGLEQPWALRNVPDAEVVETIMNRSGAADKIAAIDSLITEKEQARRETGQDRKRLGDPGKAPDEVKHPDPIDAIKEDREAAGRFIKLQRDTLDKAASYIRERCSFETIEDITNMENVVNDAFDCAKRHIEAAGKAYTQADIDTLDKQIADWYGIEEKAKAYDAYLEKKSRCNELDDLYNAMTAEIEDLREQRKKVLSDMKLGVKGLEIGEDNMLYHNGILRGITKSNKTGNWSTSESIQVFFGLGARFAGQMKVLVVDEAESLDAKTTDTITKWAEQAGFLVIMLRVAEIPEELEEGIIYVREGAVITKENKES